MKTFGLDEYNNFVFTNGNITFLTDADVVLQRVKNVLYYYYGEWFLEEENGTPWFQEILIKPVNFNRITTVLKSQILLVEGVQSITSFAITSYDADTRNLNIEFTAETIYGEIDSDDLTLSV